MIKLILKGVIMMNVLITGVASGIGNSLANLFKDKGHFVYGLDINEIVFENITSFKCDITNKDDLNKVKDYLINNNIKLDNELKVKAQLCFEEHYDLDFLLIFHKNYI